METEADAAFASLIELAAGALLVARDPFLSGRREQLVALALRRFFGSPTKGRYRRNLPVAQT